MGLLIIIIIQPAQDTLFSSALYLANSANDLLMTTHIPQS
jgi:hypothetical protein